MTPQDDWRGLYDEAVRQCNQNMNTISELEAARDHLRARLLKLTVGWQASAAGEDENGNRQYANALDQCAADLLAILRERPPEEKINEDKELKTATRVVTIGEGDTSRTASSASAGSVEPDDSQPETPRAMTNEDQLRGTRVLMPGRNGGHTLTIRKRSTGWCPTTTCTYCGALIEIGDIYASAESQYPRACVRCFEKHL